MFIAYSCVLRVIFQLNRHFLLCTCSPVRKKCNWREPVEDRTRVYGLLYKLSMILLVVFGYGWVMSKFICAHDRERFLTWIVFSYFQQEKKCVAPQWASRPSSPLLIYVKFVLLILYFSSFCLPDTQLMRSQRWRRRRPSLHNRSISSAAWQACQASHEEWTWKLPDYIRTSSLKQQKAP